MWNLSEIASVRSEWETNSFLHVFNFPDIAGQYNPMSHSQTKIQVRLQTKAPLQSQLHQHDLMVLVAFTTVRQLHVSRLQAVQLVLYRCSL